MWIILGYYTQASNKMLLKLYAFILDYNIEMYLMVLNVLLSITLRLRAIYSKLSSKDPSFENKKPS